MRIAHVVSTYPPYYGGMGNVVHQTVAALRGRGHEVMVITPDYAPAETRAQQEGEGVRRLPPVISYGNAAYLPAIKKELADVDVVHLHYPFFGTANLVRQWRLSDPSRRLVVTYHMDTRSPDWKGIIFKLYAKWWLPKILQSADVCIGSSFDYIEVSDAAALYRAASSKWIDLPFGVDTDRFAPRELPVELFARVGLDPAVPTALFVGGMDPAHHFKGVSYFLRAIAAVRRSDQSIQAVLVGDGSLREQFEYEARGLGIADVVRFVGSVSNDELPLFYNMAAVTVLPSTAKNEAFGMVLLESFASGVPVIASDLPGVRTVASRAGSVVPPKDVAALAQALDAYVVDAEGRRTLGAQGRAAAETTFSWPRIAQELESIYTGLMSDV